jgi:hypothetical protein
MGKFTCHNEKGRCDNCGQTMKMSHPSKRFCRPKCKDIYHNRNNPRGKFAHLNPDSEESKRREREWSLDHINEPWDSHKDC